MKINKCPYCIYITDVKCNLFRHINAKHKVEIQENTETSKIVQNVTPRGQNVTPSSICKKCNKTYVSEKNLKRHELKCKGVDELTCSKCMISFTCRQHKSRHIKANNCKARSIIHAREPNPHNVQTIIENQNNIQNNIQTQNNINNNIIINNFGNERIDHITHEDIKKILLSGANTLPKYIEKKHFDKEFPENNNILYTRENKCKVLENNDWKEKDIGLLSSKLIKDNAKVLLLYCGENEIKLSDEIKDDDIYQHVKNKLVIIYNKSDHEKYNFVLNSIKELVKNSKNDETE